MNQILNRRISKLDQATGFDVFDRRVRLLLAKFYWDVEGCLPYIKPHRAELAPLMYDGGSATWQAQERIDQLVPEHLKCQRVTRSAAGPSRAGNEAGSNAGAPACQKSPLEQRRAADEHSDIGINRRPSVSTP